MVYKRLKISHSMSFMINTQSVERMTVNHDVTGSSPVGGATVEVHSFSMNLNYLYFKKSL